MALQPGAGASPSALGSPCTVMVPAEHGAHCLLVLLPQVCMLSACSGLQGLAVFRVFVCLEGSSSQGGVTPVQAGSLKV